MRTSDLLVILFFFFNDTATTEIYTLSLHDALPICAGQWRNSPARTAWYCRRVRRRAPRAPAGSRPPAGPGDRKSTRLNSSHANISYAVFCLKKKSTRPGTNHHDPVIGRAHV